MIRWSLQRGYVCIPKSSNEGRIKENSDIFDFDISEEDMTTMVSKGRREGSCTKELFQSNWNKNAWFDWDVIDTCGWLP